MATHDRASSACRYARGVKGPARALLAGPRSARNEETWTNYCTLVAKFLPEDHAAVSAPAAAAAAARRQLYWRVSLTGLKDMLPHNNIGREEFGKGMAAFWRRIVVNAEALPTELWKPFLQSSLTALGRKCRPVCFGMTWRQLLTAETTPQQSVATAVGGQPRGEAVWGHCARESRAHEVEGTRVTRDGELTPPHGLLQRVQHRQQDGWLRVRRW